MRRRATILRIRSRGLANFLAIVLVGCAASAPATSSTKRTPECENHLSSASQTYWVEELASGLRNPFSLAWLPNGELLLTERQGGLRIFRNGKLDPTPLTGVPASFQNSLNGLKDVLLDPDHDTNHLLYLLISEGTLDEHHTAVYRARIVSGGVVETKRIFRAKDEMGGPGHSSARMIFLPDKTLLVGVPESHYYKRMAQRLDSHIGKIVRLNRDGSVPPDNPFVGNPSALPEIWSYGHRVPTGLVYDATSGIVWETEPGPRGGDELNVLKAGANYGWAEASWGFEYNGGPTAPQQTAADVQNPILIWTPSVTPSGIARYMGSRYPAWNGDFFVGYLSGQAMERLRVVNFDVVAREKMLFDLEERIREVKVGPDDFIYLLTDNANGRLLRLQPGCPHISQLGRVARKLQPGQLIEPAVASEEPIDVAQGKRRFVELCAACHSVGKFVTGGDIGPNLAGVYGRRAASVNGYVYSEAMMNTAQVWDSFWLNLFLADPQSLIKGTTMSAAPIYESKLRREIIEFLKQQSTAPN